MVRRTAALGAWRLAIGAWLLTGCELNDVVIPEGEEVVSVQAVMRPDRPQQFILVERSLVGRTTVGVDTADVPPTRSPLPLSAALVTVVNLNADSTARCASASFAEVNQPGVYEASAGCPDMAGGDTLSLLVQTVDGALVTGQTVIPSVTTFDIRTQRGLQANGDLAFERADDSVRISLDAVGGRGMQVSVRTLNVDSSSGIPTSFIVDTTHVKLAGDLVNVSDSARGDLVFQAGRIHFVSVGYLDRNYFDFARSTNGEVTGRGFIGHLDGGIGVFGSMVATNIGVRVMGTQADPREGQYRVTGSILGDSVDVTFDVHFSDEAGNITPLGAFVTGRWVDGNVDHSIDGSINGSVLQLNMRALNGPPGLATAVVEHTLAGGLGPSVFDMSVFNDGGNSIAVLRATKLQN